MGIVDIGKHKFSMDGFLDKNLNEAERIIKHDWDMVFCVDGAEGSGKSVLAMQCAFRVDPSFNLDRVVFNPKDLKDKINSSPKYSAIVYDEAYTGLSSRASMSLVNRTLISLLAEIRQKNLFVFVVMPCFFDLDKYVALWRSRVLIHVYTGKNFQRGFFAFYNSDRKKSMYMLGKKFYSYAKPLPNFRGRFVNYFVVDEKEYRKKKKLSLTKRSDDEAKKEIEREVNDRLFDRLMHIEKLPNNIKMEILGMASATFYRKQTEWKDNAAKYL